MVALPSLSATSTALVVVLCLLASTDARSSRCVVVSELWRGPWPNGTESAYERGRAFFDESISRCTAFGSQCEEWIEFSAERKQVLCSHEARLEDVYAEAWGMVSRHLEWFFAEGPASKEDTERARASTPPSAPPALLDAASVQSALETLPDPPQRNSTTPSLPPLLHHIHLHESTPVVGASNTLDTTERKAAHAHRCSVSRLRPVRCRLVPRVQFRKHRHATAEGSAGSDAGRPHSGWLHDEYHWECESTPRWISILHGRPLCPPFYMSETNVCIPVEECVVILDVENAHAFSPAMLLAVLAGCTGGTSVLILAMYYLMPRRSARRRAQHRTHTSEEQPEVIRLRSAHFGSAVLQGVGLDLLERPV